ncbi:MAG: cation transporting ATPase C-terminal domain-containing protein [Promethearchaeota archaeon]
MGMVSNKMMIFWAIRAVLTTILIIYIPPLPRIFKLSPLSLFDWSLIIIISIIATF